MICYALVQTADGAQMLIARKRASSSWWGNRQVLPERYVDQAGQWALPGGAPVEGEVSLVATAMRKFREQTGVDLGAYQRPFQAYAFGTVFSVVVFSFSDVMDLVVLQGIINSNLVPKIVAGLSAPTSDLVADFELAEVRVLPSAAIASFLGVVVNSLARVGAVVARGTSSQDVGRYAAIASWARSSTRVGEIMLGGAKITVTGLPQ